MRILSIMQPLAACVFLAGRSVHSLPYSTSYRGPLYIYAAPQIAESHKLVADTELGPSVAWAVGAIIGHVDLIGTTRTSDSHWAVPARVHWRFANPVLFDTLVPYAHTIGLWDAPKDLVHRITQEL